MKRAYFDTCVYNAIVDSLKYDSVVKMLRERFASGELEVLYSVNNFEEFCHTTDIDKRSRLFRLAESVCGRRRFTLSHEDLIRKELENNGPVGVLYDATDFETTSRKAINGTLFQGISATPLEDMKNTKREFLRFERDRKQELASVWQDHTDISFEEFYRGSLRNNEGRAILRDICLRAIGDASRCERDALASNLQRLPGLRCLFKCICALTYRQLLVGTRPKWGSGIDMAHSVFIGYSDVFVTNDRAFLEIVRLFDEPKAQCLTFSNFLAQHVDTEM